MLPLTKEQLKSHQDTKAWCIYGKRILKSSQKLYVVETLEIIAIIQAYTEAHYIVFAI